MTPQPDLINAAWRNRRRHRPWRRIEGAGKTLERPGVKHVVAVEEPRPPHHVVRRDRGADRLLPRAVRPGQELDDDRENPPWVGQNPPGMVT